MSAINHLTFFNKLREKLGHFRQKQVDGLELLLEAWEYIGWTDPRWLAYCLGTTWWETAHTMQPIEEEGQGKGHVYGLPAGPLKLLYYGRGYVQLTWYANYLKLSTRLNELGYDKVDLVAHPEQALDPSYSAMILFYGMHDGLFAEGHTLAKYFPDNGPADPVGARTIVNGTDRAEAVADLYERFEYALTP